MVAPVPMRTPVVAPRRVSPIIGSVRSIIAARGVASIIVAVRMGAVVSPAHHDRGGSDDHGRWDTEADVDIDAGAGRLRLRKQDESQEWDHTPHTNNRCETFHSHIRTVEHQPCSPTGRVVGDMLPPIYRLVLHSSIPHT